MLYALTLVMLLFFQPPPRTTLIAPEDFVATPCPDGTVQWAIPDFASSGGVAAMDGRIDTNDYLYVLGHWGPCATCCCPGDVNRDGMIGVRDFLDPDDLTMVIVEPTSNTLSANGSTDLFDHVFTIGAGFGI